MLAVITMIAMSHRAVIVMSHRAVTIVGRVIAMSHRGVVVVTHGRVIMCPGFTVREIRMAVRRRRAQLIAYMLGSAIRVVMSHVMSMCIRRRR
jgi:hypothetical protein